MAGPSCLARAELPLGGPVDLVAAAVKDPRITAADWQSRPGGCASIVARSASAATARAAAAVAATVRTGPHDSPPSVIPTAHNQSVATASTHSWLRLFRSSS